MVAPRSKDRDDRSKPLWFPGNTYDIVQFNDFYRKFQAYMATKDLLTVLVTGQASPVEDDGEGEEKRKLKTRSENSKLYGHLIYTMSEKAEDLSSELREKFLDKEYGFADGYEAVKYLKKQASGLTQGA